MFTKLLDADLEYVKQYYPAINRNTQRADAGAMKAQNDAITYYTQRAYQLHQQGIPDAEIFAPTGTNSLYNGKTIDSWIPPVAHGVPKNTTTGQHPFDISSALQGIYNSIVGAGPGNSYGQPVPITGGAPASDQNRQQADTALAKSIWNPQ